jgi:polyhydroxyalkanoate synthase
MATSQESTKAGAAILSPAAFAPFEVWSKWLNDNMSAAIATPGVNDPLMLVIEQLRNAGFSSDIIPINWKEIAQALQTLWMREMSNPVRAMQAATEHNRRLFETTMDVWNDAAARFWGFPRQKEVSQPDKRFSAPEWDTNPYYQTLKQMYLLASDYLLKEAEATSNGQDTVEERRLKFHLKQFVDAMAPVNFLLTNPTALKRIMETGGSSITEGVRNLLSDLQEGRVSMTDANAFKPGENLAITPGKVVYRNELIELIQYAPQTQQVFQTPILFIPPWINKYYILDLRPENSMIRYMVEQGFTVFIISWKNPDASMEGIGFDDYMTLGPLAAVDAIRDITGSDKVNPVGYCIGGTLLAVTQAWIAAGDDKKAQAFGASTFMVSMQDFADVGESEVFMDEPQFELMENQMMQRGYLDQNTTSNMFNLLRSSDLIWANVINNYLLGQKPPAFDMLYWNADGTRMTRAAHSFYIRNTYLENKLIEPGKVRIKGRPIDLSKIGGEIYAVGAEKDHIVPWGSAWRIGQLVNGKVRFVLASSGHIAGMINPPAKGKGKHWVNENRNAGSAASADEWRKNASEHDGSWWVDWTHWLASRSGKKVKPPSVGSDNYPPIQEAPGTYVKEK